MLPLGASRRAALCQPRQRIPYRDRGAEPASPILTRFVSREGCRLGGTKRALLRGCSRISLCQLAERCAELWWLENLDVSSETTEEGCEREP